MRSESSRRDQDIGSAEALETRMRGIEVLDSLADSEPLVSTIVARQTSNNARRCKRVCTHFFSVLAIFLCGNLHRPILIACHLTGVSASAAGGVHGRERRCSQVVSAEGN